MSDKLSMKIAYLFMFLLIGCEGYNVIPATTTTEKDYTNEIVADLQGNYDGCIASPIYGGYYNRLNVEINGKDLNYYFVLDNNSNCASPYYRNVLRFEIVKASYETEGDTEIINLDLKAKYYGIIWHNASYVNANYCGWTDWVLGVEREVTGVYCLNLLSTYDTIHDTFRAVDEMEYMQIRHTPTSIAISIGTQESGDTFDDRRFTQRAEVPKI